MPKVNGGGGGGGTNAVGKGRMRERQRFWLNHAGKVYKGGTKPGILDKKTDFG